MECTKKINLAVKNIKPMKNNKKIVKKVKVTNITDKQKISKVIVNDINKISSDDLNTDMTINKSTDINVNNDTEKSIIILKEDIEIENYESIVHYYDHKNNLRVVGNPLNMTKILRNGKNIENVEIFKLFVNEMFDEIKNDEITKIITQKHENISHVDIIDMKSLSSDTVEPTNLDQNQNKKELQEFCVQLYDKLEISIATDPGEIEEKLISLEISLRNHPLIVREPNNMLKIQKTLLKFYKIWYEDPLQYSYYKESVAHLDKNEIMSLNQYCVYKSWSNLSGLGIRRALKFNNLYPNKYKYSMGQLYCFDENTGLWTVCPLRKECMFMNDIYNFYTKTKYILKNIIDKMENAISADVKKRRAKCDYINQMIKIVKCFIKNDISHKFIKEYNENMWVHYKSLIEDPDFYLKLNSKPSTVPLNNRVLYDMQTNSFRRIRSGDNISLKFNVNLDINNNNTKNIEEYMFLIFGDKMAYVNHILSLAMSGSRGQAIDLLNVDVLAHVFYNFNSKCIRDLNTMFVNLFGTFYADCDAKYITTNVNNEDKIAKKNKFNGCRFLLCRNLKQNQTLCPIKINKLLGKDIGGICNCFLFIMTQDNFVPLSKNVVYIKADNEVNMPLNFRNETIYDSNSNFKHLLNNFKPLEIDYIEDIQKNGRKVMCETNPCMEFFNKFLKINPVVIPNKPKSKSINEVKPIEPISGKIMQEKYNIWRKSRNNVDIDFIEYSSRLVSMMEELKIGTKIKITTGNFYTGISLK